MENNLYIQLNNNELNTFDVLNNTRILCCGVWLPDDKNNDIKPLYTNNYYPYNSHNVIDFRIICLKSLLAFLESVKLPKEIIINVDITNYDEDSDMEQIFFEMTGDSKTVQEGLENECLLLQKIVEHDNLFIQ